MAPDHPFFFPSQGVNQSSDALVLHPFIAFPSDSIPHGSQTGPPVASKEMLEANSRRRRHPVQFEREDCEQTEPSDIESSASPSLAMAPNHPTFFPSQG